MGTLDETRPISAGHLRLEKIRLAVAQELHADGLDGPASTLTATDVERLETDTVVRMFRAYILGMGSEEVVVRWPATWWQHFRQRWFPRRWLTRWPVRMDERRVTIYAKVCPHLNCDTPSDRSHYAFFAYPDHETRRYQ